MQVFIVNKTAFKGVVGVILPGKGRGVNQGSSGYFTGGRREHSPMRPGWGGFVG